MEDQILKNYESFDEKSNGVLIVDENSNLMYIKIDNKVFIAREFINSIKTNNSSVTYITSYYDVKDNKKLLELQVEKTFTEGFTISLSKDVKMIPLNKILNIKGNSKYYLTEEDIDKIINFKEEESKEKRKYYF